MFDDSLRMRLKCAENGLKTRTKRVIEIDNAQAL